MGNIKNNDSKKKSLSNPFSAENLVSREAREKLGLESKKVKLELGSKFRDEGKSSDSDMKEDGENGNFDDFCDDYLLKTKCEWVKGLKADKVTLGDANLFTEDMLSELEGIVERRLQAAEDHFKSVDPKPKILADARKLVEDETTYQRCLDHVGTINRDFGFAYLIRGPLDEVQKYVKRLHSAAEDLKKAKNENKGKGKAVETEQSLTVNGVPVEELTKAFETSSLEVQQSMFRTLLPEVIQSHGTGFLATELHQQINSFFEKPNQQMGTEQAKISNSAMSLYKQLLEKAAEAEKNNAATIDSNEKSEKCKKEQDDKGDNDLMADPSQGVCVFSRDRLIDYEKKYEVFETLSSAEGQDPQSKWLKSVWTKLKEVQGENSDFLGEDRYGTPQQENDNSTSAEQQQPYSDSFGDDSNAKQEYLGKYFSASSEKY